MKYIKMTHDVLGLEKRVKARVRTNEVPYSQSTGFKNLAIVKGGVNYTLKYYASVKSTDQYVVLAPAPQTAALKEELDKTYQVQGNELLVHFQVSGFVGGKELFHIFDNTGWATNGPGWFWFETKNPEGDISSFTLEAVGNTTEIDSSAWRGVRRQDKHHKFSDGAKPSIVFPVGVQDIFEGSEVPVPEDATTTQGGRRLFRHPNGQGTVVVYNYWGTQSQMFVPDAKYRHTSKYYDSTNQDHGLYKPNLGNSSFYVGDSSDEAHQPLTYSRDDAWIQSTYADLRNDGTAKYNTDILMNFETTEAAHHCRAQDIPGVGQCDMPNVYQTIILYLESDNIDNLDPTVDQNRDKALGTKNTQGRFYFGPSGGFVWTSTESNNNLAWGCYYYGQFALPNYSNKNGVIPIKELGKGIVAPGGRKLYRHSSGQGTVIEYDYWGTKKKLFVADAKYRGLDKKYDSTKRDHGLHKANVTTGNFNGTSSADNSKDPLSYARDDKWIQSTYTDLKNDGTAKFNTDKLMTFGTTEAAHHCRAQNISGVGQCDLPNLYQLIILYLESDNIDNLDPTVEQNRDKALGMKNTYGRFDFNDHSIVWSSTERDSTTAWRVGCDGDGNSNYQFYTSGVVPVKEID